MAAVTAYAQPGRVPGTTDPYHVPATDKTVHWGYFSKSPKPLIEVASGDFVTIEVLTHRANDDASRMAGCSRDRRVDEGLGSRADRSSPKLVVSRRSRLAPRLL